MIITQYLSAALIPAKASPSIAMAIRYLRFRHGGSASRRSERCTGGFREIPDNPKAAYKRQE
ncbi:hypothetical protein GCM10008012_63260 [Rhizobium anhuiense]|nr:hypothetical protein GCM10008012_63260 [Rhizobium anhuiense]